MFGRAALIGLIVVAHASAADASKTTRPDPNARLLACYQEVTVPAKYNVTKVLVEPAKRTYVRKGGRVELWETPAIYREDKTLIEEAYVLMQEIHCKD